MPGRLCCLRSVEMGQGEPYVLITTEGGATAYAGKDEFFHRAATIKRCKEDQRRKRMGKNKEMNLSWETVLPGLEHIPGSSPDAYNFNLVTYAAGVTVDEWNILATSLRSYQINQMAPAIIKTALQRQQQSAATPKTPLPRRVVIAGRVARA